MSLTKIINLYDEFNNCPQNAGLINDGGEWSLVEASFPVTLCISCDGNIPANYNDIEFTVAADFCLTVHNPWIDFSGEECAIAQAPDGQYVFKYSITAGACPSESFFTLNVIDGNITYDFVRIPEICYVEAYSHREGNVNSREGVYTVTANRPTVELSYRFKTEVFDVEDCAKPLTTICSENIKTPHIQKISSVFTINPGQPITYSWLTEGIVLWHRYAIDMISWDTGGKVQNIKVRSSTQGLRDLDLSAVSYPGPPNNGPAMDVFAASLKQEIKTKLEEEYGASNVNALTVVYDCYMSGSTLQIDFLCMHQSNTEWIGIDKANIDFLICQQTGDCDLDCLAFETCDFTQVINVPIIENQCTVTNCDNYDKHLAGQNNCLLRLYNRICYNGSNILDFDDSNYNTLVLAPNPRANVLDYDDPNCYV